MESADLPVQMESVATQISGQVTPARNRTTKNCSTETQTNEVSPAKKRRKQTDNDKGIEGACKSSSSGKSPIRTSSFIPILPNSSLDVEFQRNSCRNKTDGPGKTCIKIFPRKSTDDDDITAPMSTCTSKEKRKEVNYEDETRNGKSGPETTSMRQSPDIGVILSIPNSVIETPEQSGQRCAYSSDERRRSSSCASESGESHQFLNRSQDIAIQTFSEEFQKFLDSDFTMTDSSTQVGVGNQVNNTHNNYSLNQELSQTDDVGTSPINSETQTASNFLMSSQTQTHLAHYQDSTHMQTQTIDYSFVTHSETQTSLLPQIHNSLGSGDQTDACTGMDNVACSSHIQTQTMSDEFLTNIQTQTVSDFDVLDLFMNSMETQTHNDSFLEEFSFSHSETQTSSLACNSESQSTGTQTLANRPTSDNPKDFSLASMQTQTTNQFSDNFSTSTQTFSEYSFDFPLADMETQTMDQNIQGGNVSTQTSLTEIINADFSHSTEGTQTVIGMEHGIESMTSSTSQAETNTEIFTMADTHTQTNLEELDQLLSQFDD